MDHRTFAVVAGGGTAGHVLPALAVADALVRSGHDRRSIHYTGTGRGIEARLLPPTGYPFTLFDVSGFGGGIRSRAVALIRMVRARRTAIGLLRRLRPRVVVSVGGYASLPAVLAARRLSIPVVVVSYDAIPGRASRMAARRAAACAVAFADSTLPRATLTGAPVRDAILAVDRATQRAAARHELGLPMDRFVVTVLGGSQGSGALNGAVWSMVADRAADRELAVLHIVGERFLDSVPATLADLAGGDREAEAGVWYRAVGYEERMPEVYAATDLLIGRGGASTVHEVAVTGTPAILVPWAASADDHQRANVESLSRDGAARLLTEADLDRLDREVDELRADPDRLAALGTAAAAHGQRHRTGAVAALIESAALA